MKRTSRKPPASSTESERPVVYFGGGVRSAAGCQPLRDLLEKAGMPATYTLMAAGVLSYGEPHNLGLLGMHGCYAANKAIDEADLVIAVGTRFSDRVALNPDSFAKRAKIIQIDIDPSELGKNVDVDFEPDRRRQLHFAGNSALRRKDRARVLDGADPRLAEERL